jgi:prepilin-type N-terminal cleavage/methylation domain-containing protein
MSRSRSGFTLIELLVVVSIIAIISSMFLVLIGPLRRYAKSLVTCQRLQSLMNDFSQMGKESGSATLQLQLEAGIEGVQYYDSCTGLSNFQTFAIPKSGAGNMITPTTIANAGNVNSAYVPDYLFAYPWGKLYPTPDTTDATVRRNLTSATGTALWSGPDRHFLNGHPDIVNQPNVTAGINPFMTEALLNAIKTAPEPYTDTNRNGKWDSGEPFVDLNGDGTRQNLYRTDRNPRQPWNDNWGHPLVVAYALFQPTRNLMVNSVRVQENPQCQDQFDHNVTANPEVYNNDTGLTQARNLYQYDRSVYLVVAAAGPYVRGITDAKLGFGGASTTDSDWNDTTNGNLVKIWRQATDVCQQKKEWDETSFGSPPWQGVRQGNKLVGGHAEYCFLTAPMELH